MYCPILQNIGQYKFKLNDKPLRENEEKNV